MLNYVYTYFGGWPNKKKEKHNGNPNKKRENFEKSPISEFNYGSTQSNLK